MKKFLGFAVVAGALVWFFFLRGKNEAPPPPGGGAGASATSGAPATPAESAVAGRGPEECLAQGRQLFLAAAEAERQAEPLADDPVQRERWDELQEEASSAYARAFALLARGYLETADRQAARARRDEISLANLVATARPPRGGEAGRAALLRRCRERGLELVRQAQQEREAGRLAQERRALEEAWPLLSWALVGAPEAAGRRELAQVLDSLTAKIVYSPHPLAPDAVFDSLAPGEALVNLARRHETTARLIMLLNNIVNDRQVPTGRPLKILPGAVELLVRKGEFCLLLLWRGLYLRWYDVGLGLSDRPTPVGLFCIANNKDLDPTWYPPEATPIPHEDPRNPLGSRWLGLEGIDPDTRLLRGFGIHGCRPEMENTIGQQASQGCIRLRNRDVEVLYDLVPVGTLVHIVN